MIRKTLISIAILFSLAHLSLADNARDKTKQERTASYKKVGITGDRLDLLIDHGPMYGIGGGELATPKQLKLAKVMFEVSSSAAGWTVRRYMFDGDRLARTTSKTYLERPGARAFR